MVAEIRKTTEKKKERNLVIFYKLLQVVSEPD